MTTAALAILLTAVAVLFLGLCFVNRATAAAVFAALLPAYLFRFSIPLPLLAPGLPELPTTLLEVLFLELFAVWFFTDGLRKGAWSGLGRWAAPILLLMLGATIGVFVSPDLRAALGLWRAYFLEPVLFFAVFTSVIRTDEQRRGVIIGLGACLYAVSLAAVYQKLTGFGIPNPLWAAAETRRVTAFYGYPNAIGLFAAPVIVLLAGWAAGLFLAGTARARVASLLPIILSLLGLAACLFAVSKGAIIGAFAGLAVLGLLVKKLRGPTLALVIAGCLAVMLYAPALRLASSIFALRDQSGSVRAIGWEDTIKMLADHPVFGAGLSGFQQIVEPYHEAKYIEIFMYPHDIFLNFWTETGLIGLAGFVWLTIMLFAEAVRQLRRRPHDWLPSALLAALVAVVVHGLVDVPYMKNDLAMLFWILAGLIFSLAAEPLKKKARGVDEKAKA